jgi:putative transposase
MRGPKPPTIDLTDTERQGLKALTRRRTISQQIALRARIILDAVDGHNNCEIARQRGVSLDMVRLWRERWIGLQAVSLDDLSIEDRLADVPRSGRPARITAEQVCQMVALACEAPSNSGRPISQWTGREIADEIIRRQIVSDISPRHASRLVKKTI